MTRRDIGETLRAARIARGETQVEVAVAVGVSVGTVQGIENGARNPSLDSVIALADYLGFRVEVVPITVD